MGERVGEGGGGVGLSSTIAAPAYPYILQFGLSCCGCGSYPPPTPRPPEAVPQCEPRSADKIILKSGVHLPEHARSKLEFPFPPPQSPPHGNSNVGRDGGRYCVD